MHSTLQLYTKIVAHFSNWKILHWI